MRKPSTYQSTVRPINVLMIAILVILAIMFISFIVIFIKEFGVQEKTEFNNIYLNGESSSVILPDETSSVSDVSSESVSSEETVSVPNEPVKNGLVPESEKVLSAYFSDAVFIGDSITEGIKLYGIMRDATILSYTGLGLDNIYTKEVIEKSDGTKIPIMDAVRDCDATKFYVLIGVNSIQYSKENFIKKYGAVIDSIKGYHPNAIIYVQSITPVCEEKAKEHGYDSLNNKLINEYNEALLEMTVEKDVYYLDIHSALADQSGALPADVTTDGLHFGATHFQKWFDYLKTHTVG